MASFGSSPWGEDAVTPRRANPMCNKNASCKISDKLAKTIIFFKKHSCQDVSQKLKIGRRTIDSYYLYSTNIYLIFKINIYLWVDYMLI
jgi:hypothetical protein